jgi:hypothetical protein
LGVVRQRGNERSFQVSFAFSRLLPTGDLVTQNSKILVAVALLVVGAAAGFAGARAYERSQCVQKVASAEQQAAANADTIRRGAEEWAQSLARAEGEAILRSFTAGLAPVVLTGRETSVDVAGASLLRLAGVQGVTILRADGKTLYASDAKLTVSDVGSEQTRWALTATDFMTRDGPQPGLTEMSLPVTDRGKVLAIVWLAYDSNLARERLRPAELSAPSSPADPQ